MGTATRDADESKRWRYSRAGRVVAGAAMFALSYYGLQRLAFLMRVPPFDRPPIWLPGALLLGILLVVRREQWFAYVVAFFVTSIAAFWADQVVGPVAAVITAPFIAAATVVGAWAIRRSDDGGRCLTSQRSLIALAAVALVLIPAAVVLPIALYGAANGQPHVWFTAQRGALSVAVGTLIATPALALTFAHGASWLRSASRWRYLEALLLAAAVLVVGAACFMRPAHLSGSPTLLYAPLPLLVWAALRFELAGVSWALLAVALQSSLGAVGGRGPFTSGPPAANVLQLQLFLLAVSVPLMFLAAVMQERRRALAALGASEERYREVVESQKELVCRYQPDTTLTFVNDAYCRFFSKTRDELIGRKFLELLPPAAREPVLEQVRQLAQNPRAVTHEHEVVLPDGTIGWQQWVDFVAEVEDGRVGEFQAIGRDITDRKRAEEALRRNEDALRASYTQIQELAGRLISAQEGERTRLARELHDNVSQQLAALSIALSVLRRKLPPESDVHAELTKLQARAGEMAEDIRHLSHELHPGVLRHAGLVAALRSRCAEFGGQHGLETSLRADADADDLIALPPDVSLCLYRVAQETLRNVVKHAKAKRAKLVLARDNGCLQLSVADDGIGFDAAKARASGGLGLISLDERVRLLNGNIIIESRPHHGTEVRVRVPLKGRSL